MMTVIEKAYAKVNLYLHVIARRQDGYHELDSLVVFADIYDVIEAEKAQTLSLEITGPGKSQLKADEQNLVLRAASLLKDFTAYPGGAHLKLEKNLPLEAGIGGGSSDAAATLRALCRLWQLEIEEPDLLNLAVKLGADVPVCVKGKATLMRGIGEALTTLGSFPEGALLLVNPGVGLSTPAVFKASTFSFKEVKAFQDPADFSTLVSFLNRTENDLIPGALKLAPVLEEVLAEIKAQADCACARMSGSGSTCFGLFKTADQAKKAMLNLKKHYPGWWVQTGDIIS